MPAVNAGTIAAAGVAGEYTGAGGRSVKVDEKGFELNQTFIKGMIGALCVDQIVNGYLSPWKLNTADNDPSGLGAGGYTTIEHYWDEGVGYLYGLEAEITAPTYSGNGSVLLNKYAGKVNTSGDIDMNVVYDALKAGRTAIVNMDYSERDAQGIIARELISKILGVKASDYLRDGAAGLADPNNVDMAEVIHDLSQAYGFILSLQFAKGGSGNYLFPKAEVDVMLANLEAGNGLWDIDTATLISMADVIDARFLPISACTDPLAINYNPLATIDDSSCIYCDLVTTISQSPPSSPTSCDGLILATSISTASISTYSCTNSLGSIISSNNFASNLCMGDYFYTVIDSLGCTTIDTILLWEIYGCTDPIAQNFNGAATVDDGSCFYCDLTTIISPSSPSSSSSCDGIILATSISTVSISTYSCTNSQGAIVSTNNFASNLCSDGYIYSVFDSLGCSTVDTILLGDVYGCTDSLAFNYQWFANLDDGSCIPTILGCTDPSALNFDSLANTDDGSCCVLQFSQIGQNIDGEVAGELSGYSVSLSSDGNTVAIGASYNSGSVRLFTKISDPFTGFGTWTQIGQDIDGEAALDRSGFSVSLSSDGNTVAIGAPNNDGNGTYAGHVRIYENIAGSWSQIGSDIDSEAAGDRCGWSVSLSSDGNTVAIGAPRNVDNGTNSGHVRIYENVGGSWSQIGQDIDGEAAYNYSGISVSLSSDGNTVAIGAPRNGDNGTNAGHVRIYENIGGSWSQIGQDIDGETAEDRSGNSVSLSSDGNTVAIGAFLNDGNGNNSGHVRIYENISGSWSQIGSDIDGEAAGDVSGYSVSLSSDGNTVAIGANQNVGVNGYLSGHVRIYANTAGSWMQIGQDIDGESSGDMSGHSVFLSSDGNTVAIGAPNNDGNGTYAGHVRIFDLSDLSSDCAGCIDPLALNYDSTIQYDDGSCIYPTGCTDPTAYNYDSIAITDDGSCLYCDLTNTFLTINNSPGNCDGFIIANSNSLNGPISYLWSTGSTQNNIIGLCAGVYSVVITDNVGCTLEDTVYMNVVPGCMDPLALNYDPLATVDDGSCTYSSNCSSPKPTGLFAFDVIDTRAKVGWDNMNDSACMVLKYFVRYREVGTSQWTTKSAGVGNGLCNFGLNTVTKQLLNLTPSTTYEFRMKAFYCGGISSNYSTPVQFTTADPCPDMTNLTTTTFNGNQSKVRFNWDTTGVYTFARVLLRVDTAGANWQTAGGFGIYFPTFFVNKFGLIAGQSYRAQGRTFCDSNITAYRSPTWTSPIFWTQPGSIREGGGLSINNLDIYPNPSIDVFNISFNSDKQQDLSIRILNVVGAEVYREDRQEFVGEYIKQISLDNYGKGIYFLEIQTPKGIVNKKLILQ